TPGFYGRYRSPAGKPVLRSALLSRKLSGRLPETAGASRKREKTLQRRERVAGALVVPGDREDPPAVSVVEELDAVDPADEGLALRRPAELVRGEDVGDVSEAERAPFELTLEEGVLREHRRARSDVPLDVEHVRRGASVRRKPRRDEPRPGEEEPPL